MSHQEYRAIPGFDKYVINRYGDIINVDRGLHLKPSCLHGNRTYPSVRLSENGSGRTKQHEKSVRKLCLEIFPEHREAIIAYFDKYRKEENYKRLFEQE